jgi:hypothetical protein
MGRSAPARDGNEFDTQFVGEQGAARLHFARKLRPFCPQTPHFSFTRTPPVTTGLPFDRSVRSVGVLGRTRDATAILLPEFTPGARKCEIRSRVFA